MANRKTGNNKPPAEPIQEVDFGEEPLEPFSLNTLESKYREQMRQIFPVKIDLPLFGLKSQIDAQIDLTPDFQRRDRWPNEKRSRFIESIIMNIPVPPVFLGEEQYGKYAVLDGRQRLTALYLFLDDKLKLEGLQVWTELNALTFSEMKAQGFGATIERRFLNAVLLTKESSPEVKYEVFDRLNTGGVIAEPMEVRNAVFRGGFNELLHELSSNTTFRELWGIPKDNEHGLENSALYKRMDDLELVLRFFALQDATLHQNPFKDQLSLYMDARNKTYETDRSAIEVDRDLFLKAINNCKKVFGADAFRKHNDRRARSAPLADAVMHSLANIDPELLTPENISKIRQKYVELMKNEKFIASISSGTNGESSINSRIEIARTAVKQCFNTMRDKTSTKKRKT